LVRTETHRPGDEMATLARSQKRFPQLEVESLEERYAAGRVGFCMAPVDAPSFQQFFAVASLLEPEAPPSYTSSALRLQDDDSDSSINSRDSALLENPLGRTDGIEGLEFAATEPADAGQVSGSGENAYKVGSEALLGFSTNGPDWANSFLALFEGNRDSSGGGSGGVSSDTKEGHRSQSSEEHQSVSVNGGFVQSSSSQGVGISQGGGAGVSNVPSPQAMGIPIGTESGLGTKVGTSQLQAPWKTATSTSAHTQVSANAPRPASNTQGRVSGNLGEDSNGDDTSTTSLPPTDWSPDYSMDYTLSTPSSDLWYTNGMNLSSYSYVTQVTVSKGLGLNLNDGYPHVWTLEGASGIVTFAGGGYSYTTPGGISGTDVTLYAVGASPAAAHLGVTITCTQNGVVMARSSFDVRRPSAFDLYDWTDEAADNGPFPGFASIMDYQVVDQFGKGTYLDTPVNESLGAWTDDYANAALGRPANNWTKGGPNGGVIPSGFFGDTLGFVAVTDRPLTSHPDGVLPSGDPVAHSTKTLYYGNVNPGQGTALQTDRLQLYTNFGRALDITPV
jgi:hypothetical protein